MRQESNSLLSKVGTIETGGLCEKGNAMTITQLPTMTSRPMGVYNGSQLFRYEITHPNGLRVALLNYGATIQELHVPDADGVTANVVLGFARVQKY